MPSSPGRGREPQCEPSPVANPSPPGYKEGALLQAVLAGTGFNGKIGVTPTGTPTEPGIPNGNSTAAKGHLNETDLGTTSTTPDDCDPSSASSAFSNSASDSVSPAEIRIVSPPAGTGFDPTAQIISEIPLAGTGFDPNAGIPLAGTGFDPSAIPIDPSTPLAMPLAGTGFEVDTSNFGQLDLPATAGGEFQLPMLNADDVSKGVAGSLNSAPDCTIAGDNSIGGNNNIQNTTLDTSTVFQAASTLQPLTAPVPTLQVNTSLELLNTSVDFTPQGASIGQVGGGQSGFAGAIGGGAGNPPNSGITTANLPNSGVTVQNGNAANNPTQNIVATIQPLQTNLNPINANLGRSLLRMNASGNAAVIAQERDPGALTDLKESRRTFELALGDEYEAGTMIGNGAFALVLQVKKKGSGEREISLTRL